MILVEAIYELSAHRRHLRWVCWLPDETGLAGTIERAGEVELLYLFDSKNPVSSTRLGLLEDRSNALFNLRTPHRVDT